MLYNFRKNILQCFKSHSYDKTVFQYDFVLFHY